MSIIGLLLVLVLCCLVYWAATRLMAAFGIGEPIHTVVIVVLVLVLVLLVLGQFGYGPGTNLRIG